jgi:hypothetical protein
VPEKYAHLAVQRGFALRLSFVVGRGVVRRHGPAVPVSAVPLARPDGATLIAQPGGCEFVCKELMRIGSRCSLDFRSPTRRCGRCASLGSPLRDHLRLRRDPSAALTAAGGVRWR